MATGFVPIEHCRTKFYLNERYFKGFSELSDEQLVELSKKVYRRDEIFSDTDSRSSKRFLKLEKYQRTLQYLTSFNIHLEYKSFDERLAFLIMMSDPNLVTFKEFLKLDLMSLEDISKVEDIKERNNLIRLRSQTISEYETRIREQLGFFDVKLLKYEELYFKKFFGERELVTEVGRNTQDKLLSMSKKIPDFSCISDKRYKELVDISNTWLRMAPTKYNSYIAAYSVTNQSKLLGINNLAEQLVMYVLLVDSNLDMLRIYEEESQMKYMEERTLEEFGYFNTDLLELEKKFHNRFCPKKRISIWTKIKKD